MKRFAKIWTPERADWYRKKKKSILISTIIIGVLMGFAIAHHGFTKIWELFLEHSWLELASGVFLYFFLDAQIKKYGDVPTEDGPRKYNSLLKEISKSRNTVRILDNDFSSFFETTNNETDDQLRKDLNHSLYSCILSLEPDRKIQILLLHPDTAAAQQRNEDLQFDDKDLYSRMNEGLQFLQNFYDDINKTIKNEIEKPIDTNNLKELIKNKNLDLKTKVAYKIMYAMNFPKQSHKNINIYENQLLEYTKKFMEVRLFKSSYSVEFVSWDEKINFSLLPPTDFSNTRTFKTLQSTQLAINFNDNFEKLWENRTITIPLENYKKVVVRNMEGEIIARNIAWGNDSYDHNLPVFIYVEAEYKKIIEGISNFNSKLEKDSPEFVYFQIIHDNAIQFAAIERISQPENVEEKPQKKSDNVVLFPAPSLIAFAQNQIEKKSGKIAPLENIYMIKYRQRNKIELRKADYVKKQLDKKGYCYTSHADYKVQVGLHLKNSISALYSFFIDRFDDLIANKGIKESHYQKLFSCYTCEIKDNGSIVVDNFDAPSDLRNDILTISEISQDEAFNKFIKKTISADFVRIFGEKYKVIDSNNVVINGIGKYYVRVDFIRAKLKKGEYIEDWANPGVNQNTADYTVLHFVGKKNILGGVPFLWFDNNHKLEKEYTFNSALDSVYFKRLHIIDDVEHHIKVDSSGSYFHQFNKGGDVGFRNLLAIEIFSHKEDMLTF